MVLLAKLVVLDGELLGLQQADPAIAGLLDTLTCGMDRALEPLTLADLVPHQGAALADSFGVRKHIEAAQVDEQVTLKPILVTNSFKVLWSFAAMGLGYVLTPRSVPLEGPRFSEIVSLPLANPLLNNCRSHLVTRDGRPLPPAPERMLGHALELFRRI